MENEVCKNCGRAIGKLEQAFVYKDHVVCEQCDKILRYESLESPDSVSPGTFFSEPSHKQVEPPDPNKLKLRHRRPAFAYFRSGLGLCLLSAFLLPWLRISCDNNTIMHPSGFNLVTGVPDPKTKGMLRVAKEVDSSLEGFSQRRVQRSVEEGDFSYWDIGKAEDADWADAIATTRLLLARIALTGYGLLLMPALVVLSGALLWGQFEKSYHRDPPWDARIQDIITVLAPLSVGVVLAYGLLVKPSEIPPMLDMNLDWGFYLTLILLATLSVLLFLEERRQL